MIDRRAFLSAVAAGALSPAGSQRPNIVLILCDDLGYGDLGCYGNRIIRTPNVDALAGRGVRFTQFYTTSPVCSPTRTAIMTGDYPQRFGIHHADMPESLPRYPLPAGAVTISAILKKTGYATAHVGKWHLGEPPETIEPRKRGFDYFAGCLGGRPSSAWIKYARSMDPEMVINEERPKVFKGHVTEIQTRLASDWLSRTRRDQPFFLNLWYNAPHEPLAPLAHQKQLYGDWSPEEQTYFQSVTDMDAGVGRILAQLDELGVRDNTLVLFTSDNGPEAHRMQYSRGSAGPLKGMKTQLWEGGVRVPAILFFPGKAPQTKVTPAVASVLDLFPTFSALAGVKPAAGSFNLLDIAGERVSTRDRELFFEFHFPQRGVESSLPVAVRKGRWKLFSTHSFGAFELYDLDADPSETRNVARDNPAVVATLKPRLQKWWAQFADKTELHSAPTRIPPPEPEELDKKYYRN